MAKLTLNNISNISGAESTAIATINNNSAAIETALENTLSRNGVSPNTMNADIDLNGNDLLNVGTVDADNLTLAGVDYTDSLQGPVAEAEAAATAAALSEMNAATSADEAAASAAEAATFDPDLYVSKANNGSDFADPAAVLGNLDFLQSGTGSVARSAQDKMRDIISVKDFGAVGDGVTDDTAAFDAAFAESDLVYVSAGDYNVTKTYGDKNFFGPGRMFFAGERIKVGVDAASLQGATKNAGNVANSIVQRTGAGDIITRLFRSEYANTNGNIGAIMTQVDVGGTGDNYVRPSTPAQVAAALKPHLIFQDEYQSSEQSIVQGGAITLSHGLGGIPTFTYTELVCKVAEAGYSVGDRIGLLNGHNGQTGSGVAEGIAVVATSTQLQCRVANVPTLLGMDHSNGNRVNLTLANWRAVFRAWR